MENQRVININKKKGIDFMGAKTYSYRAHKNVKLSDHFKVCEFRCKDWSDRILINPSLINVLEKLYDKLNCGKINVTSGYRTPSHSVKVGGYRTDQHTKGNAVDIICYDKKNNRIPAKKVCCALELLNHKGGIGYINTYSTHLDVRGYKCWFDETKGSKTTSSWYGYWKIKKPSKTPSKKSYSAGVYEVTCSVLTVRTGAGTGYEAKKYNDFTVNAKEQIKEKKKKAVNGYVKGMRFTATQIKNTTTEAWAKTPSGWVCIENKSGTYCKKVK